MVYDNRPYYPGTSSATSTNYIWTAWNTNYTQTTVATTSNIIQGTTDGYGWPFYTTNATAGTVNQYVWTHWMAAEDARLKRRATQQAQYAPRRKPTDEEVRDELAREKAQREAYEAQLKKTAEAHQRAEDLLRAFLSPQQREDLEKKQCFYVEVPGKGGKLERYRIDRGTHGNVKQVNEQGSILRKFCVQPEGVPVGDSMLAQKLFLESSDETRDEFWKTANITTLAKEKEVPTHIPRHERRRYAAEHGLLH